jgi:hypothetical protein
VDAIAGVNRTTIEDVIAEIGPDMSVFPDEHHLSSREGICPGNEESAGKRLRSRTTRKNRRVGSPCQVPDRVKPICHGGTHESGLLIAQVRSKYSCQILAPAHHP